jgi:hypothetical protein
VDLVYLHSVEHIVIVDDLAIIVLLLSSDLKVVTVFPRFYRRLYNCCHLQKINYLYPSCCVIWSIIAFIHYRTHDRLMYSASLGKMLENISKLIYLRVSKMIFSDYRRIWSLASGYITITHSSLHSSIESWNKLYAVSTFLCHTISLTNKVITPF